VDDLWAAKSEHVGLIVHTISLKDFQPKWSWSTNVTDRRTDDKWLQDRALHCSASRGKNHAWVRSVWRQPDYSTLPFRQLCAL